MTANDRDDRQPENPASLEAEGNASSAGGAAVEMFRISTTRNCPGCNGRLEVSVIADGDGCKLLCPEYQGLRRNPLTVDATGIYCGDCGTHLTEAEELVARSKDSHGTAT